MKNREWAEAIAVSILVFFVFCMVLLLSHIQAQASEFRLPVKSLKGDTLTAYISTGATEAITSGTPYIGLTWRMDHAVVRNVNSSNATFTVHDNRYSIMDSYTPSTIGLLTLTAGFIMSSVTMNHTEVVYIDDLKTRIDSLAQILSASPVTTATAVIVTGGTIIDRADAGWGTRMYPRYVPSGGQGETIMDGLVYDLATGVVSRKFYADIFDFISVVTGTVQAKIRTPMFDTYTEINTHILAEAYPSGWGGTRSTETPSFAKP